VTMFMALAPADSSCSQAGTLGCGFVKLTTAITSGASVSRRFSISISAAAAFGFLCANTFCDHLTGTRSRLALEHDKTPGSQLAVIGHPRADGQDGFEFGRRGAGPAHVARFDRAAVLQEVDGVGHCGWLPGEWFGHRIACEAAGHEAANGRLEGL